MSRGSRPSALEKSSLSAALLAGLIAVGTSLWSPRTASANDNLYFNNSMKNYTLDVMFWGVGFTPNDYTDVLEYLDHFTKYVNGVYNPPGKEPAVHYYGLWGLLPGTWIVDPNPITPGTAWGQAGNLDDILIAQEITSARNGAFGPSFDFQSNQWSDRLPSGPNRLVVVVTKGANPLVETACFNLVHGSCMSDGVHGTNGSIVWAGVSFDQGPGNVGFPKIAAHEITEAMTAPALDSGWETSLPHSEACDECGGDWSSMPWTSSTSRDISGVSQMTLNPSYGGINNIPSDSCQTWEPEEYAPMGATFEYGGPAGTLLTLVYLKQNGNLGGLSWAQGQSASGGGEILPPPGVSILGKPAIVYAPSGGGQYIFMRGSDSALWQYFNGAWTRLGGTFFGDPTAVVWNNGINVNVFVLGTDDHLYNFGISNGSRLGWFSIDNNTTRVFSGAPKAFAKSQTSIDLFAIGENGHLEWIPWSTTSGWSALTDLGTMLGNAHHNPVSITSWGSNRLDIFATSESAVGHRGWTGSWASDYDARSNELGNTPSGTPAVVSWGTNRLDAFMIDRQNRLTHTYYDGNWHSDPGNPFATNAVGDPIVMSRGVGQLDVLYRTTTGSLTHFNFNPNNGWTTEANILPQNSIQ
jgi:hypothetical protein